ncbi:MAG: flagellar hook-length control protein FliK [Pseudorhodoplanes sp.]|nr:flagellar hook-length control protein FliK [Pseudorhodoplanes sp.]
MPSVLPDLNIFPTRPAEPRQPSAARDREGPSRFESLVDESEPDTQPAGPQLSPARESKSSLPAGSAEPSATPSDNQSVLPAPDAPPIEAPVVANNPATDFAAVTAALAAAPGGTVPEGDNATEEPAEGAESDADPAALVVAAPAPERPQAAPAVTVAALPVTPVVAAPIVDGETSEGDAEGGIVENAGRKTSAPAMPADQLAALTRTAPKEAANPSETGEDATAQMKPGEVEHIATDDAPAETDTVFAAKKALSSDEDQDADIKSEAPPAPPERADGKKPARTPDDAVLPVAAAEERAAAQPSRDHALQPLAPVEHQSVTAQGQAQANTQAQARPIVQAVPVAAVPVEIAAQARAGKTSFEIRLDPPELGRIDVRLDIDHDGKVTSRLTVERAETLDVLRRDAHSIERALNDAGLKTSDNSLQFSLRDQGHAQRDRDDTARAERLAMAETELAAQSAAPIYNRLAGLGSGLDIRV